MATTYNDATTTSAGSGMTAASILEVVLRRIQHYSSEIKSIDEELKNTLLDITGRDDVDFLKSTTAPTVVDGTASFAVPTGYKRFIQLELADVGVLDRIDYDVYQNRYNVDPDYTGEPCAYAEYNGNIYLWPTSDDTYTTTLSYAYTHPYSTDTILLEDCLREAVYNGVIMLLFRGRLSYLEGAAERAEYHSNLYEKEIYVQADKFRDRQPRTVKYRSI